MLGKTVIVFKSDAQALFTMLYVGARLVAGNITKSTLYSMAVHGACGNVPMILFDKALKPYTFKELAKLGEDTVRDALHSVMKKDDIRFYNEMKSFGIRYSEKSEDMYEPFATKILRRHLILANLRDTDIENIVKVILISEDDLRADESPTDEESEEGLARNDASKNSYSFLKYSKPYACYGELDGILNRYKLLMDKEKAYKKLFGLFFPILDFLAEKNGYSRGDAQSGQYYEAFDSTVDFYKIFCEELKSLNLEDFMQACELDSFKKEYSLMLKSDGGIAERKNCSCECKVCVYSTKKCVTAWLKRDMGELLRKMCFFDIFEQPCFRFFEEYCMEDFLGEKKTEFTRFVLNNATENE